MKASELKKGEWYKFYSHNNGCHWYVQPNVDGDTKPTRAFIGDFGEGAGKFYKNDSQHINHDDRDFEPADMSEINYLLPEEERITSTFEIY